MATNGENVALGKTYVKSQLFQQAKKDDGTWGWMDDAPVSYPDTDDKELTDGVHPSATGDYTDAAWMGFHKDCPDYQNNSYSYFTVDLGEIYALSKLTVDVGTSKLTGGIGAPATVEFLISEDGENFTSLGVISVTNDATVVEQAVEQTCDVTAQYVQVRMTSSAWMFVSEFEAS